MASDLEKVLRSMASEDRLAILDAMVDGASSPVQASRQLELPLANVAYHVRSLRDAGLLRERGYRQARGAVENLYEVTPLGLRVRVAARTVADAVEEEGQPAKGSRRRVKG
jgi:DNA-binding transcriptional ArsR family regulator